LWIGAEARPTKLTEGQMMRVLPATTRALHGGLDDFGVHHDR